MTKSKLSALIFALSLIANSAVPAGAFQTFHFTSAATKDIDSYAFARPIAIQKGVPGILLVFFHGFGQDYTQPFKTGVSNGAFLADIIMSEEPGVGILSVSYGRDAWGNEGSLQDVTKNISDILQVFKADRVVLFGLGSGASVALNYACVAPPEVKEMIAGVLATEPTGDLVQLYNQSPDSTIKPSMQAALGTPESNPKAYLDSSFLHNAGKLNSKVKICLITTPKDGFSKVAAQKDVCKAVKKAGCRLLVLEGPPLGLPPLVMLKRAIAYVLHPGTK